MWLLPSRGRPSSVLRFFSAWKETQANSRGVLWLDDDDAHNYEGIETPEKWQLVVSPRIDGTGPIANAIFKMFPNEPFYGFMGDDVLPRTKYWDRRLIDAAGTDGLSYGDDGVNGIRHAAHSCMGGDRARELGWLALPGCKRTYIDNALMEDAKRRGKLFYCPDVITEHLHFSFGKSPMDATYQKTNNQQDKAIFDAWMASHLSA